MSLIEFLKEKIEALGDRIDDDSKAVKAEISKDVDEGLAAVKTDVSELVGKIKNYAIENIGEILAALSRIKPILVHDKVALVTRFDDVQEVMSRSDVFETLYPEKLAAVGDVKVGAVGTPNIPAHMTLLANMQTAFRRDDIPTVAMPFIQKHADQAVAASKGRLDIIGDLTEVVPRQWISHYVGVPDTDPGQIVGWSNDIFHYVFAQISNDPTESAPFLAAAKEFRAHVDAVIAARKKDRGKVDDVLERFLNMQDAGLPDMDDGRIRANLMIFFYGTVVLTSKAVSQAIDYLLDHPKELAGAQAAAASGDLDLVGKYVWEALRFFAVNPGLFRTAMEDYTVAKGTHRATTIPKGTLVFAAFASAMMDKNQIEDPTEFRLDRPEYQYMHFGYGLHECFGRFLSYQQVPLLVASVLKQKNLRRAPGKDGQLQIDGGIFTVKMVVEFDV